MLIRITLTDLTHLEFRAGVRLTKVVYVKPTTRLTPISNRSSHHSDDTQPLTGTFPLLFRKDLAEYQKNCEDLKEQLKHKESLLAANVASRVGGLCLKCAQHEAVLSHTHGDVHVQTIERLTK